MFYEVPSWLVWTLAVTVGLPAIVSLFICAAFGWCVLGFVVGLKKKR